jgi:CheY-specific phosphatase CheX
MSETVAVGADWSVLLEEATREVFTMMLGCEVQPEARMNPTETSRETSDTESTTRPMIEVLFRDSTAPSDSGAEVTAVVGIAGELCGVFNFACGTSAARMMAAKMLGVDEAEAGDQQWDAIGEICNMVAGNFKSKLPGIGERCLLSVPTIVVGSNYRLRTVAGRRRLDYRFHVNLAPARVTLDLQR